MRPLFLTFLFVLFSSNAFSQQAASTTVEYASRIMTSNFTVPLIRFNKINDDPNRKGSLSAFNSLGAGISFNAGRLFRTTNQHGEIIDTKFKNTVGVNFGVLFSANSNEEASNVFALTTGLSLLNFQIGIGHELGTVEQNQSRFFTTVSYNIPLHVLVKESFHIFTSSVVEDKNRGSNTQ